MQDLGWSIGQNEVKIFIIVYTKLELLTTLVSTEGEDSHLRGPCSFVEKKTL